MPITLTVAQSQNVMSKLAAQLGQLGTSIVALRNLADNLKAQGDSGVGEEILFAAYNCRCAIDILVAQHDKLKGQVKTEKAREEREKVSIEFHKALAEA